MTATKAERDQKAMEVAKAAIEKRKSEMGVLQVRLAQIDETLSLMDAQAEIEAHEAQALAEIWDRNTPGQILGAVGKAMLAKHVHKYGFQGVLTSMEIAASSYMDSTVNSKGERVLVKTTVNKAFEYIGRICYRRAQEAKDPLAAKAFKLSGLIWKKYKDEKRWYQCEALVARGLKNGKTLEEIESIIATSESWDMMLMSIYLAPFEAQEEAR